ncbi:MAG: YhfC family glutamic-type intramembrane protease [Oscillospiraceae bacterium]|nr:YhfC family glutamic-type intramembrane protease [Oscillospiraceae bacterium]
MEILSSIFAIVCSFILPVVLAVIFCVRRKGIWKPILFGALTFIVFQVLTRIPLIQLVLPYQAWYITLANTQPIICALFLGGTAALFEEGGRYLVMALFLKKNRSTSDGIAFGVGHGGIEAVLLVGIGAVIMLFTKPFPSTPILMFARGIERVSTLMLHIGWSVMVMKSLREKNLWWLLLAFAMHTIIDFAALTFINSIGIWELEAAIFAVALPTAWFVLREYKKTDGLLPKQDNA